MRQRHIDCLCGLFFFVLGAVLLHQLSTVPHEGRLFPASVLILIMACAAVLAARGGIALLRGRGLEGAFSFFDQIMPHKWFIVVGTFACYTIFAMEISFLLGTFLMSALTPLLLTGYKGKKQILVFLAFSSGITLVFYIFFIRILHFNFPALF